MTTALEIKILDKVFHVNSAPGEHERLKSAVDYLNSRFAEIAKETRTVNVERIAVMAALNLTYDLLALKLPGGFDIAEFQRRIDGMSSKLDAILEPQDELFE